MNIGTNLFGIGKYLSSDPAEAVRQIADAGFSSVEPMLLFFSAMPEQVRSMGADRVRMGLGKQKNSVWLDGEAPGLMELYRKNGLQIVSAQVFGYANRMIPDEKLARTLVDFGRANNLRCFVVSGKAGSPEEAQAMIPSLKAISAVLKENGMMLLYHNHEMELHRQNGRTALEHILDSCPELGLELDVGWVQFAGEDPVNWIKKYENRLILLHLKDICPGASEENKATCYRAVGEGCIPLRAILDAAGRCPIPDFGVIIDQDDANTDFFAESRRGVANIIACKKELQL